jgi:putative phage-type endonuclease
MFEYIKLYELEELQDELDTLIFEDEPSIFTDEYAVELVETALHLMDDYMINNPNVISEPDFHDILLEDIKDIFYAQFEDYIDDIDYGDDIEDDMNDLLEDAFNIFITTFLTKRSSEMIVNVESEECQQKETNEIAQKIQGLRDIPQPVQRTPEWYKMRWNLITASNAYKALDTQASINQLIYEKCQPLKTFEDNNVDDEVKMVNTNTAMHWGQKYEPLSVMLYEDMYKSLVEDFGCIQHPFYKFLGASPDGIVIKSETGRYGRMLEIKNPVSREITGIPKKEYWIQMQLQMEVCDLDECDFLETKFSEYSDYASYKNDILATNKGSIIYFHTKEGAPFYAYQPLNICTEDDINKWEDECLEKYQTEPYNYIFIKFIYWKLDKLSCILVSRNREWFKNNIGQIEKVWKIIEEERITGYEHRAPIKKTKKETGYKPFVSPSSQPSGCLLNFTKIVKLDTTNNNV